MQTRERAKVYDTGDIVEIDAAPARKVGKGRRAAWKHTTAGQRWINARRRQRYVRRMLQLNFGYGAILYTLTYADEYLPEDMDGVRKDFALFVRKMRRRYQREGIELKYLAVIERGEESGRIHIHVVQTGGVGRGEILGAWRKAHGVWEQAAEVGEWGYDDLDAYLLKCGMDAEAYEHAYIASRNLEKPKEEPEGSRMKRQADEVLTKSFCEDLMRGNLTREEVNARFPGYKVMDFHPSDVRYNPYTRGYIVHLRLLRVGARLPEWATTRNGSEWVEAFSAMVMRCFDERQIRPDEEFKDESRRLYGALRERWEELRR